MTFIMPPPIKAGIKGDMHEEIKLAKVSNRFVWPLASSSAESATLRYGKLNV